MGFKDFCSCSSLRPGIHCWLIRELREQSSHLKKCWQLFFSIRLSLPNSSEIRRPVDDLSLDSRHWADFDLDSAPLSSYLQGFRRYGSYRIDWLNWLIIKFTCLFHQHEVMGNEYFHSTTVKLWDGAATHKFKGVHIQICENFALIF